MRPVTRRARAILGVLAASMALMVVAGPVAAASPQPVTFTIDMHWEVGEGTFHVTSGGGQICDSGTVVDNQLIFGGYQSGRGVQILVRKTFICDDGVFFLKMQVHANPDGTEVFSWVIQGGTGANDKLRGSGDGTTVPGAPGYNKASYSSAPGLATRDPGRLRFVAAVVGPTRYGSMGQCDPISGNVRQTTTVCWRDVSMRWSPC